MWFWFSIIALLCWSGSDLFSKIGCREANDKTAHLKMVMAVGIVRVCTPALRSSSTAWKSICRSL